jgi:hypothetical protein
VRKFRKSKFLALLVLSLLVVLPLMAGHESAEASGRRVRLIIGTGGVAGSYYPTGGALARVWTKYIDNVSVSAQSTGASIENTRLLEDGEIELGLTQTDLAEYAINAQHMFRTPSKHLTTIASLFAEHIMIFVDRDSDIKSVADLKGKRVSVGSQGSGGLVNSQQIFSLWGITFDDIRPLYLTNVDAVDRMKDGLLDAIFVTTASPNAAFQDLAISRNVRLLGFSDDDLARIRQEFPFFKDIVIPAGTYQGQEQDIKTVAVRAVLAVRDDLDEEIVYNLTKVLWENKKELSDMMVKLSEMDPEDPVQGITIGVHPGAVRYYKEKGVWKQ